MVPYRTVPLAIALALGLGTAAGSTPLAEKAGIVIEDGRATAPRPGAPAGAVFLTIENTSATDERLLSIDTDAAVRAELHATEMQDGVARMRPMDDGLPVPAGTTVRLQSGGLHVMLMGLTAPLADGGAIDLTLHFEGAGDVPVRVPVSLRKPAAGGTSLP